MIVPVMAISNLVLTRQIYSEETNGAHAHYREPGPLKEIVRELQFITFRPFLSPTTCGSKNYSYLPHGRDFSLDPPLLWKFQSSFIHLLKIFGLWKPATPPPPPPPRNFQFLLWGEYGYFLEWYNDGRSLQGSYKKLQPFFKDFSRTFQGPH